MAFLGSSNYSLDAKNRVFIPAKYREELGNVFYITRSLESCLTIYTEEEWTAFLQNLDTLPVWRSKNIFFRQRRNVPPIIAEE